MPSLDEIVRRLPTAAADAHAVLPDDAKGLRAAVAVVMREGERTSEVLFIRRAERVGDPWSGHMAFPGGRRQSTDANLLRTATRETLEEIGLDLESNARTIARLPDVMPYARMPDPLTVTAFVFVLERPRELVLNEEVAEAVWEPLDAVLENRHATRFHWKRDGFDLDLPAIRVGGHVVWGLTYRMLELLREALIPR